MFKLSNEPNFYQISVHIQNMLKCDHPQWAEGITINQILIVMNTVNNGSLYDSYLYQRCRCLIETYGIDMLESYFITIYNKSIINRKVKKVG